MTEFEKRVQNNVVDCILIVAPSEFILPFDMGFSVGRKNNVNFKVYVPNVNEMKSHEWSK